MKLKSFATASILMCTSLFTLPTLANFSDVEISNDTCYTVSFAVNGTCSPEFGTVYQHSLKTVKEEAFKKACKNATAPCQVVIHSSKQCQGETFATINYYFDTNLVETFGHHVPRIGVGANEHQINLVQAMDGKKSN